VRAYRGLYFTPKQIDLKNGNQIVKFDRYQSWATDKKEAEGFMREGEDSQTVGILMEAVFRPSDILVDIREVLGEHWDYSLEEEIIIKPGNYRVALVTNANIKNTYFSLLPIATKKIQGNQNTTMNMAISPEYISKPNLCLRFKMRSSSKSSDWVQFKNNKAKEKPIIK